jgi:Holliday junction resolvase RusA-like endonuclease
MTQSFFVPGAMPRFNVIIGRASRWAYSTAKKEWDRTIQFYIKQAKIQPVHRVYIRFLWQEKNRKKDPDNIAGIGRKFLLDALVHSGVLKNDGWDHVIGWEDRWIVDPDNPGVVLTLEER